MVVSTYCSLSLVVVVNFSDSHHSSVVVEPVVGAVAVDGCLFDFERQREPSYFVLLSSLSEKWGGIGMPRTYSSVR